MYLKEICFISQSVVSDMQPYKSVLGSNRTEGTSKEALANPGIHNPDQISHHKGNLHTVANDAETIDRSSYRFHKYPVFNTGLQMLSITTYHIFGMGYTTQRSSPG